MNRSLDIWQLYYVTTPKIKTRYDFNSSLLSQGKQIAGYTWGNVWKR